METKAAPCYSRCDLKGDRARGCWRARFPPKLASLGEKTKHPTTTNQTHKQLLPLHDKRRRFILLKCVEGVCSRAKLWHAILCLCRSSRGDISGKVQADISPGKAEPAAGTAVRGPAAGGLRATALGFQKSSPRQPQRRKEPAAGPTAEGAGCRASLPPKRMKQQRLPGWFCAPLYFGGYY